MVDLQQFVLYFYPKAADSGHVIVRAAPRHHYDSLRGHLFQHSLTSCYPGFNWHCGRENLEERTMETRIFKRVPFAEPRPNAGGWRPWADIGVRQPFKRGEGIWLM